MSKWRRTDSLGRKRFRSLKEGSLDFTGALRTLSFDAFRASLQSVPLERARRRVHPSSRQRDRRPDNKEPSGRTFRQHAIQLQPVLLGLVVLLPLEPGSTAFSTFLLAGFLTFLVEWHYKILLLRGPTPFWRSL